MAAILRIDEVLEALESFNPEMAKRCTAALSIIGDQMAQELAKALDCTAGPMVMEGAAFGGMAAAFRPKRAGQEFPEVFTQFDDGAKEEWGEDLTRLESFNRDFHCSICGNHWVAEATADETTPCGDCGTSCKPTSEQL